MVLLEVIRSVHAWTYFSFVTIGSHVEGVGSRLGSFINPLNVRPYRYKFLQARQSMITEVHVSYGRKNFWPEILLT
jgi:hypothetical protein